MTRTNRPQLTTKHINAIGWDEGNRSAARSGRKVWTKAGYRAACSKANELFAASIGAPDSTSGATHSQLAYLQHAAMVANGEIETPDFQPIRA